MTASTSSRGRGPFGSLRQSRHARGPEAETAKEPCKAATKKKRPDHKRAAMALLRIGTPGSGAFDRKGIAHPCESRLRRVAQGFDGEPLTTRPWARGVQRKAVSEGLLRRWLCA